MRGELQAKPISVNGTDYPSTAAAIRSLRDAGLTRAQIAAATGAKLYFVNSTLTDAVRAWPASKQERMRDIIMRSLETIADMTGVHEEDVLAFAVDIIAKVRRDRMRASMMTHAAPEPVIADAVPPPPAAPPLADPPQHHPTPSPVAIHDEPPVKQLPPAPKKLEAALSRPRPTVRKTAPKPGIDPLKLFNLRDPASGEWLHQTIMDADEATLTTIGKAYRYTQTVATIQRLKAKHKQFAGWELVPIVQVF